MKTDTYDQASITTITGNRTIPPRIWFKLTILLDSWFIWMENILLHWYLNYASWYNAIIELGMEVIYPTIKITGGRIVLAMVAHRTKPPKVREKIKIKFGSWFVWIEDFQSHKTIISRIYKILTRLFDLVNELTDQLQIIQTAATPHL